MVGNLPATDVFYIMLTRKDIKDGTAQLVLPAELLNHSKNPPENLPEDLPIAIDAINSKRKLEITDHNKNEIDLNIKLDCRLVEIHSSLSVGDKKITEKIEEEINKKMESEIKRIIEYSQEVNSDIFGFGEHFYAQVRNSKLTEEKWRELYPEMKVNVKVDTEIIRNGVTE
ncbi:Ger(x)C family spore germination C-terminal domain-containing protein [Ureibacillus galli]